MGYLGYLPQGSAFCLSLGKTTSGSGAERVTVAADDLALGDLGLNTRQAIVGRHLGHMRNLHASHVVKLHRRRGQGCPAVGARRSGLDLSDVSSPRLPSLDVAEVLILLANGRLSIAALVITLSLATLLAAASVAVGTHTYARVARNNGLSIRTTVLWGYLP